MDGKQLQLWLNARGASLVVDGKPGAKTRAAIFDVFTCKSAKSINDAEIAAYAKRLGGKVRQLQAVAKVESAGGGWNDQGQPKALYERHYAWKRLQIKIPFLSDPSPGGYTIDADKDGLNDSWEKIADLALRNPIAAFESASFGKFQIMGAWAAKLGYANALDFAYSMVKDEAGHYEALVRFIDVMGGRAKFQALSSDWRTNTLFSVFYNGPKQKGYDHRLAEAMK